jgi:hypothetical protein
MVEIDDPPTRTSAEEGKAFADKPIRLCSPCPQRIVSRISPRTTPLCAEPCPCRRKALRFCHKRRESIIRQGVTRLSWARFLGEHSILADAASELRRAKK